MKSQTLSRGVAVLALAGLMMAPVARSEEKALAESAAKAEKVTITGKLSCTFCTLAHPDKLCAKGCCEACIKAGDPPSLTDADGNMFLLLTGEKATPLMNAERMELIGKQVSVSGMKVMGKGLQAIYVDSISKAGMEKTEAKK